MTVQEVGVETEVVTDQYSPEQDHYLIGEMDLGPDLILE